MRSAPANRRAGSARSRRCLVREPRRGAAAAAGTGCTCFAGKPMAIEAELVREQPRPAAGRPAPAWPAGPLRVSASKSLLPPSACMIPSCARLLKAVNDSAVTEIGSVIVLRVSNRSSRPNFMAWRARRRSVKLRRRRLMVWSLRLVTGSLPGLAVLDHSRSSTFSYYMCQRSWQKNLAP